MEWIGDLERLVAENLYPLRVPLAILGIIAVVVLATVAIRRDWGAAARRHPVHAGILAVALVAVLAPVTWYLASPLFIRIELDEPPPVLAADATHPPAPPSPSTDRDGSMAPTSASTPPSADPTIAPTAAPTSAPTSAPTDPPLALEGRFRGADDFHFGRGRAHLLETAPGRYVVRFERFAVRNGPDLYVYLSPDADGYAKGAIELGRLRATDGSFNTKVPEGTDVSRAKSVVIWCKQFSVLFAVARLEP